MQITGKNGDTIASGTATKDAEYKKVGEKNTPLASFALAVNRNNTDGVYVNCKAFGDRLAAIAKEIKKGDKVFVTGFLESREYNGKTYVDTNCDFVSIAGEFSYLPGELPFEQNQTPGHSGGNAQSFDNDAEDDEECIL